MAQELGISTKTLNRKIKDAGLYITPGLLTPDEQDLIYRLFRKSEGKIM